MYITFLLNKFYIHHEIFDTLLIYIYKYFLFRQAFHAMKKLSPKNIILYTYVLENIVNFLRHAHSMGILSPDVKLILTTLVSINISIDPYLCIWKKGTRYNCILKLF